VGLPIKKEGENMPTGYTAAIKNGITFEQFVWSCARAFGALVEMRDDPADAPIPDRLKPSDYHQKKLVEIEAKFIQIEAMSPEELTELANKEYANEVTRLRERISESLDLKEKYTAMLSQVKAWVPPSDDHREMKAFMVEQIESSIKFDCGVDYYEKELAELQRHTGAGWQSKTIVELVRSKAYHTKEHIEEVARVEERNTWLRQLRESVPMPVEASK